MINSSNEFLDDTNFEQDWDSLDLGFKQQCLEYWKKMDIFQLRNKNHTMRDLQLALFMSNGIFSVAQQLLNCEFRIGKLLPQVQKVVFDYQNDNELLSEGDLVEIQGKDDTEVRQRFKMIRQFITE